MFQTILLSLALLTTASYTTASTLSKNLIPCATYLPQKEYNACVLKELSKLTPDSLNEFKPLDIPSIDPYVVPSVYINESFNAFSVTGYIKNVQIYGGKVHTIKKVRMDPKKLTLYLQLHIPHVEITGQYDLKGTVLKLPIFGTGNFQANLTDVVCEVAGAGQQVADKNEVKRITLRKLKIKNRIVNASLQLQPSNSQYVFAARTFVTFFNLYPRPFLDLSSPIFDKVAVKIAKQVTRRVFSLLSTDEIFPAEN